MLAVRAATARLRRDQRHSRSTADTRRAVIGRLEGDRLRLEEVHRFPNGPVRVGDSILWDILRLWSEVKAALQIATHKHNIQLAGIGIGIAIRGNALAVTGVIPRGGAAEAGLAPGDLVLRVDGVPVEDLGFQGAVDAIRGPEGTTVLLTLRRGTETIEVRVPRRIVRG